ncbi:hypothetical protein [Natronomonas marina]|uniref:hypothetical protein n=1 Tax=Natronomonas marina TaxID=2961939 RepID=UPI0020C9EE4D|nr:hypothetical protein [Natronomonas marina]
MTDVLTIAAGVALGIIVAVFALIVLAVAVPAAIVAVCEWREPDDVTTVHEIDPVDGHAQTYFIDEDRDTRVMER